MATINSIAQSINYEVDRRSNFSVAHLKLFYDVKLPLNCY